MMGCEQAHRDGQPPTWPCAAGAQEDKDCTFQPAVGFNAVTLGLSRGHSVNLGESTDEMMERLTFVDRQRREHAQQARLAELQAGECTFKPSINEKSRKMARVGPAAGWSPFLPDRVPLPTPHGLALCRAGSCV